MTATGGADMSPEKRGKRQRRKDDEGIILRKKIVADLRYLYGSQDESKFGRALWLPRQKYAVPDSFQHVHTFEDMHTHTHTQTHTHTTHIVNKIYYVRLTPCTCTNLVYMLGRVCDDFVQS